MKSFLCALAASCTLATAASADPALWRVSDADSEIYFFGSIHILKPDTQWRTPELERLLTEADEFYYELPMTAEAQAASQAVVMRYAPSRDGRPVDAFLNADQQAQFDRVAASFGLHGDQLQGFRPWFAAVTLSLLSVQAQGYDPQSGVEAQLSAITPDDRERALESYEQQFGFFDHLPDPVQSEFLAVSIEQIENEPDLLDDMVEAWAAGDVETLNRVFHESMLESGEAVYQSLIIDRNTAWTDEVETLLEGSGLTLFIVGAGHLVGPDSVPAMLEARGYEVERVEAR